MNPVRPPDPELLTATGLRLENLLRPIVEEVARDIVIPLAQARNPKYTGGVFCMWGEEVTQTGIIIRTTPLAQFPIGTLSDADGQTAAERWVSYTRNSWVKCERLRENPRDIASALSADPDHEIPILRTYQGGIRAVKEIIRRLLALSGFPADLDEMLIGIVAKRIGIYSFVQQMTLAETTKNEPLREWLAAA